MVDFNQNFYLNQYLFLVLFILLLLSLISLIIAFKYILVLYRKMCRPHCKSSRNVHGGIDFSPEHNPAAVITNNNHFIEDGSSSDFDNDEQAERNFQLTHPAAPTTTSYTIGLFQFPTDDSSLINSVIAIQLCRREIIQRKVDRAILYEALEQKTHYFFPYTNKKPTEEDIFGLQLQLLNTIDLNSSVTLSIAAKSSSPKSKCEAALAFANSAMLEKKSGFLTNIRKVQKIFQKIWITMDIHRHCIQSSCLSLEQRWICRLLLEANLGIDNDIAGHATNPDMKYALFHIDTPSFLIPIKNRRQNKRRRPLSSPSPTPRSSSRQSCSRIQCEEPPPKFDTIINLHHPDLPPSYEKCIEEIYVKSKTRQGSVSRSTTIDNHNSLVTESSSILT